MSLRDLLAKWRFPLNPQRIPFEPHKTKITSEQIVNSFPLVDLASPPSNFNLSEAYKRVSSIYISTNSLAGASARDLRLVPWMLYAYATPLCLGMHLPFCLMYMAWLAMQKNTLKRRAIQNLWHVLLMEYRVEYPLFTEWATKMTDIIKKSEGPRFHALRALNAKYFLFSSKGVGMCTEDAFRFGGIARALESREIKGELTTGGFARQVFIGCLQRIGEIIRQNGHLAQIKVHLAMLETEKKLFDAVSIKPVAVINPLLSPFTSKQANNLEHEYRDSVKAFILKRFGDPRLPEHRNRWSEVSPDLRAIIMRWLIAEELDLFFHIIEKTADRMWKERRTFWLKYFERKAISEAWPILGSNAQHYAQQSGFKAGYASLSGGGSNQSVLLLRIGSLIVAEWSHDGACRIWHDSDMSAPEFYKSKYDSQQLRTPSMGRIHHQGDWQGRIKAAIFQHTRIMP